MKLKFSTLFFSFLLLTGVTYETQSSTFVLKPSSELTNANDSGQCMTKKLSSKPSLVPKLKCRFS
jgi:hypothetical protein